MSTKINYDDQALAAQAWKCHDGTEQHHRAQLGAHSSNPSGGPNRFETQLGANLIAHIGAKPKLTNEKVPGNNYAEQAWRPANTCGRDPAWSRAKSTAESPASCSANKSPTNSLARPSARSQTSTGDGAPQLGAQAGTQVRAHPWQGAHHMEPRWGPDEEHNSEPITNPGALVNHN
jgi:hypothetical protein